jgi:hypothetical protein
VQEVEKTVRLVCPHCAARLEDTPRIRHQLRQAMHYIPQRPQAAGKTRFWAYSGVAVYPWADLVKQFLAANMQLELGDMVPMSEFVMKGLNEPWSEDVILDGATNSTGDYEMTAEIWVESQFGAMTIDVQEIMPYFWFLQRDWTDRGPSRLRRCGYCNSWDELRALQRDGQIMDRFTHADCSYKPAEVYQKCAELGWIAFRGRDEDNFIHSRGLKTPVRRYFSEPRLVDPAIGTEAQGDRFRKRAVEIMWANTPVKDILARLYGGKGVYFGVPKDVPQYYLQHMTSERKQIARHQGSQEIRRWMKIGKRPNHLWDCEAMQVAFALIKGPLRTIDLGAPAAAAAEKPPADT